MADQRRTDELKEDNWIKVLSPRGMPWQKVKGIRQIDEGTVVPIYRISFNEHSFDLIANGDRVFEVEYTTPAEILLIQSGMALPPSK